MGTTMARGHDLIKNIMCTDLNIWHNINKNFRRVYEVVIGEWVDVCHIKLIHTNIFI